MLLRYLCLLDQMWPPLLSSQAAAGEILFSTEAAASAGMQTEGLERRALELKGINEKVPVQVIKY